MADNKKLIIRKCVMLALLLAVLAFLFVQRDNLRESERVHLLDKSRPHSSEAVSVTGNHVIEQPVVPKSDVVGSVGIMFIKQSESSSSGLIEVALTDHDGNTVAETSLDASYVQSDNVTKFMLGGQSEAFNANRITESYGTGSKTNIKVTAGETYTVRISFRDVACDGPLEMEVCSYDESGDGDPADMSMDGRPLRGRFARLYLVNRMYSSRTILLYAMLFLLAFAFVIIPFEKIDRLIQERSGRDGSALSTWISRMMFIAAPLVSYFIIQKYAGFTNAEFTEQLFSGRGFGALNLMIIGLVWWLLYTLSNSVRFSAAFTVLLASAFGFINYILVLFRDSQLVATDIAQLDTALQVADSYRITFNDTALMAVVLTGVWIVAAYSLPAHKGLSGRKRLLPLAVLLIWGGAFYHTFISSSFIEDHDFVISSFKPKGSYNANGSALSFVISMRNSMVRKPEGYDAGTVEALAEKYPSDKAVKADRTGKKTPNVIVIMNESFSDMSVLGEFGTNEDYMPFYRSLRESTISGWMDSSVFGGSTANSEFEFLTGFTTRFMPYHSVPFRSNIKGGTPSLAYCLKDMGYGGNIAFHPGMRDSYNRDVVYPLLGFDRHIAYEDLDQPEKIRDFVSDSYDYRYLEQEHEAFRKNDPDAPFWMFNVTIQNHGGYALSTGRVDAGISDVPEGSQDETVRQFLNLMKYSDDALKELIEYYSNSDEKTVILLFGDHQPRLADSFYANLRAQHPEISELEWSELMHRVPFMIWANYDLPGSDVQDGAGAAAPDRESSEDGGFLISANYLAPYLKQTIGLPLTGFDKYLLDLRKELPVISDICCIDAEGSIYDPDEAPEFENRLNEYAQIQYNGLIDKDNRVEDFFRLKQ